MVGIWRFIILLYLLSCMINFFIIKKVLRHPIPLQSCCISLNGFPIQLVAENKILSVIVDDSPFLWSISVYTPHDLLSIYYVPGGTPMGQVQPGCLRRRRANAQDQKPEVTDPVSSFSICLLPSPLPLWSHHLLPPHTPAAAMLASSLPGTCQVSSLQSRAVR